ncbi:MAG: DUF7096 domain-containing protein [Halobacteriota archaeon]
MRSTVPLAIVLATIGVTLLLAGGLGTVSADGTSTVGGTPTAAADGSTEGDEPIRPGERFAGAVGVHQAELDSAVTERAFDRRLENASDDEQATVSAARIETADSKLESLRERKAELDRAHENGSISTGAYHARIARVDAEVAGIERGLNRTAQVTATLPERSLERAGVDADKLEALRSQAGDLRGAAVREIAREIAGPPGERPGAQPTDSGRNASTASERSNAGVGHDDTGSGPQGTTPPTENRSEQTTRSAPDDTTNRSTDAEGRSGAGPSGDGGVDGAGTERDAGGTDPPTAGSRADRTEQEPNSTESALGDFETLALQAVRTTWTRSIDWL